MNTKKIGISAFLSLSIVAVLTGTTGMSLLSSAFAGSHHHNHVGKNCKENGDDNCNNTENNQKPTPKDDETTIKDHSKKNDNGNVLVCSIDAVNLKDSLLLNSTIFGDTIQPVF